MRYNGFCGPSNPSQSVVADGERLTNWFIEPSQSPYAATPAALYPTPGRKLVLQVPDVDCHGIYAIDKYAFAAVGAGFYELFNDWSYVKRGAIAQDSNPATYGFNPQTNELCFSTGGNAYVYNVTTFVLTQVLTAEATMVGAINGRFLAFNAKTGRVKMSALNDGLTWPGSPYEFGNGQTADPWRTMIVKPPEIWFIGQRSGAVWYDTGAFPQPYAPINGAVFPVGICGSFAGGIVGGQIMWVTETDAGSGQIVSAQGYSPKVISNYAIDTAIRTYSQQGSLSDTELLAYQDQGHTFACFTFRLGQNTWCVDSNGLWHERRRWNQNTASWEAWRARGYAYCFGKHLTGDWSTGVISELDTTHGLEADGAMIRRVRVPPSLWAERPDRLFVERMEVIVEPGLGVSSGQGSDPLCMLRTSTDGKTWSAERKARAGRMGEFGTRVAFSRCGSSEKLWVPEFSVTDPIPWRVLGADVQGSGIAGRG